MDPTIWGPSYWFFLHTVAFNYPKNPTTIQKKIHYRLIHNFHEFLPNKTIAGIFVKMLEKYPITPYLDTQKDFIQWMHFIHNQINIRLNKPTITLEEHYMQFHEAYEPPQSRLHRFFKEKYKVLLMMMFLLFVGYTYIHLSKNGWVIRPNI